MNLCTCMCMCIVYACTPMCTSLSRGIGSISMHSSAWSFPWLLGLKLSPHAYAAPTLLTDLPSPVNPF